MPPKTDKTESKEAAAAKEAVDTAVSRLETDAKELTRWRKPLLEAFDKVEKGLTVLAKSQNAGTPLGKEIDVLLNTADGAKKPLKNVKVTVTYLYKPLKALGVALKAQGKVA